MLRSNRMNSPSLKVFNYSLEAVRDIVDDVQVPDKQLDQNSEVLHSDFKDTDPGPHHRPMNQESLGVGLTNLHC